MVKFKNDQKYLIFPADQLQIILKELLETPHTREDMAIANQAKNLYQSCISMDTIEQEGETPLTEVLTDLGRASGHKRGLCLRIYHKNNLRTFAIYFLPRFNKWIFFRG